MDAGSLPLTEYAFLGRLQQSSQTVVCRARTRTGRAVAIKGVSLHASASTSRRLAVEATRLRALRHPGIVSVLDAGLVPAGDPWSEHLRTPAHALVLPLAGGGSLAPYCGWLRWSEVWPVLHQLVTALGYLHGTGLLHCDIKPANVLVREDADPLQIELADLDAAHPWVADRAEPSPVPHGTPGFRAPEQRAPGLPLGPWTDLYGVGRLTWALLCGRVPEEGQREPEPIPARTPIPPTLIGWLRRLLAPGISERFTSTDDALAALDRLAPEDHLP